MQSRGGLSVASVARERPVRLFLSGPAAGVIGGQIVGTSASFDNLITIDIGGTSADIALISRSKPMLRAEGQIGEHSLRVPMVDVNTIGAGGGSIAGWWTQRWRCPEGRTAIGRIRTGPRLLWTRRPRGDGDGRLYRVGLPDPAAAGGTMRP